MMKRVEIDRMLTGKESKELAKNVKDAIAYLRAERLHPIRQRHQESHRS